MKKLFVLFLVTAFLLAGCGNKMEPEVISTSPAKTTTPTAPTETAAPGEDLNDEINAAKEEAEKCLEGGVRSCLPVNFKIGEIGDTVIFAYGIKSQEVPDTKYRIVTTFIEYQRGMATLPVEAEDETMNAWVQSEYKDKVLQSQDIWTAPAIIKIGSIVAPDKETQPGTYVFEIKAMKVDKDGFTDDYEAKRISVKVK